MSKIVSNKLADVVDNVQVISASPAIASGDVNQIDGVLKTAQDSTRDFTTTYSWVNAAGSPTANSNATILAAAQKAGVNVSQEQYFLVPKSTGTVYLSATIVSNVTGKQYLLVAQPSYDRQLVNGNEENVFSGVHNPSNTAAVATPPGPQDFLNGVGLCGDTAKQTPLAGQNGRCGYGPRLPLLVISPWAKHNFVDHTLTDQSSIVKFVQDNWKLPKIAGSFATVAGSLNNMFDFNDHTSKLFLDPVTGQRT